MDNAGFLYLAAGYGFAWIFLTGYIIVLWLRQGNLYRKIRSLEKDNSVNE